MLWKEIVQLLKSESLVGCAIQNNRGARERYMGLEPLQCYSVIDSKELDLVEIGEKMHERDSILRLLKIRNPWPKGSWTGPWSPKSDRWVEYDRVASLCGQEGNGEEGSFWMWDQDFFNLFDTLFICRIFKDPWRCTRMKGKWFKPTKSPAPHRGTAMGPPTSREPAAWLSNPQFHLFVKEKTPCVIILSQRDSRAHRDDPSWVPNSYEAGIGFAVAKMSTVSI